MLFPWRWWPWLKVIPDPEETADPDTHPACLFCDPPACRPYVALEHIISKFAFLFVGSLAAPPVVFDASDRMPPSRERALQEKGNT